MYSLIKTFGSVHLIVLSKGITYDFVHCSHMCNRPALYIPQEYFNNGEFRTGILFMIIGIMTVLILEYLSKNNAKSK